MKLIEQKWEDVAKYLENNQSIIVPIGSVEQHGPVGLLGTDAITAEYFGNLLAEKTNTLVTPVISVGMAQHHMGFPGTITLRPSTLMAVVEDYVESLASQGFKNIFFVNGHGGNVATVETAFSEIYAKRLTNSALPEVKCKISSWFMEKDCVKLANELFENAEGYHATPGEISVTALVYPTVLENMQKVTPDKVTNFYVGSAKYFRETYPDGVMGSYSHLATKEAGQKLSDLAISILEEQLSQFVK